MNRVPPARALTLVALALGLLPGAAAVGRADTPEALLARIKGVGKQGQGNVEAARAWKELTARGPEVLLPILDAVDDDDPVSANWLRTAADAVAEQAIQKGQKLPVDRLEGFLGQTGKSALARRIAYEWLCKADPEAPRRWLPRLLHDPSVELRRDGVAFALEQARDQLDRPRRGAGLVLGQGVQGLGYKAFLDDRQKQAALDAYRKALSGAVDKDQVDQAASRLRSLGEKVDLAGHFGFVRTWWLVQPFDNTNRTGFEAAYPPEKGVDLKAVYRGKNGAEARWVEHTSGDPYGKVDLNEALGKHKGTVAYAYTVIDSPEARPVEIRAGSFNALKIFLNGKEVFGRDEYHHGMRLDQHVGTGTLKKGRNELLLKVCQNEQTESWAQSWVFQVRLCDRVGVAVPFSVVGGKAAAPSAEGSR